MRLDELTDEMHERLEHSEPYFGVVRWYYDHIEMCRAMWLIAEELTFEQAHECALEYVSVHGDQVDIFKTDYDEIVALVKPDPSDPDNILTEVL